jgi:hypothetical protein
LKAGKPGWVQTNDFLAKDNRVVLIKAEEYSRQQLEEKKRRDKEFERRRPGESSIAYYCRVVLSRSRSVGVDYFCNPLKITSSVLDDRGLLFLVQGELDPVQSMSDAIRIGIDMDGGRLWVNDFTLLPGNAACGDDMFFVKSKSSLSPPGVHSVDKVTVRLARIRAGFTMEVWKEEVRR